MAIKLRPRWVCRSNSKLANNTTSAAASGGGSNRRCDVKWELRPGGMLVQKRESESSMMKEMIEVRVSTGSCWYQISIEATSTFGQMKMMLSLVSGLEASEQRLLFKGKEREDCDHLHMVGVRNMDKVLLLEDPAIKERKKKLHAMGVAHYTTTIEV